MSRLMSEALCTVKQQLFQVWTLADLYQHTIWMRPLCSKSLKSSSPLFSSMTSTFISTRAVQYVTTFLFIILLYFPQPLTSSPDVPFIHEGTHIHRSLVLKGNKRTSPVKASSRHSLSPAPSDLTNSVAVPLTALQAHCLCQQEQ